MSGLNFQEAVRVRSLVSISQKQTHDSSHPMSRAALYHAAVDSFKEIFDTTTTVRNDAEFLMVNSMRSIVPRDATDSQFEAVYALAKQAVIDNGNHDSLTPLPFETALVATSEDHARLLIKLKYLKHLERNDRPRATDHLPVIRSYMPPLSTILSKDRDQPSEAKQPLIQRTACLMARLEDDVQNVD